MILRPLFIIWILWYSAIGLIAQTPYYFQYNTEDGLPSSEVYDVEMDSTGLIWFSTDRGVCTYDGYDFKTYTSQNGLADNTNFNIYKDSKERLWFTGHSGRISIYDKNRFYPYPHNDSLLTFTDGYWLADVIEIREDLMLTSKNYSQTINAFFIKELNPPIELQRAEIVEILPTIKMEDELIILGEKKQGLHYYINYNKPLNPYYLILNAVFQGDFVIYHQNSTLSKSDLNGRVLDVITFNQQISRTYIDDTGNLWVGTANGLFYFENSDLTQVPEKYFEGYHISGILQDQEGSFWITTNQNGVLFVPSFDIKCFRLENLERTEKRHLSIGKLEKHIFFGTADSKIIAIDEDLKIRKIPTQKDVFTQVRYINRNNENLNFSNGNLLTEKNGKIAILEKSKKRNGYVKLLNNGETLSFSRRGFLIYRGNKKNIISVETDKKFTEKITIAFQDSDDIIWIGGLKGLFKITDYNYGEVKPVLYEGENPFGRINDIYGTPTGDRWIATIGNGLFYHTADTLFQLRAIDGLNSDLINQIMMTNDSTVWLATNKGVDVFNYRFEQNELVISNINNLTTKDGLSSNYINDIDYWKGQIWLATNNGISSFTPDVLNKKYPTIQPSINRLVVNDISYAIDQPLLFKYNENDVFINFTGISFKKSMEQPFYRYRLKQEDGVAEQWYYTNEKNIRYSNMAPGTYTFEVSAQNKSGEWSAYPATVSFEIQPHFMETWWFLIACWLVGIGVLGFVGYRQVKRVQNKQNEERKLQEAELRAREAELAVLRNQMNPHFVFNSLNSIQNFIFKKDVEKANYYLSSFSALMRNSLEYTRLDFITLEKELDFLKNYLELELMRFENKFDFEFKIDETVEVDDLMVPSLLLQPVIENSIKHAFKHIKKQGKIEIEITQDGMEKLNIYIRDNGSGLDQKILNNPPGKLKHRSLGLEIIQNRIKLLNERNYKTKASVSFKNYSPKNNRPQGFLVYFILPVKYQT